MLLLVIFAKSHVSGFFLNLIYFFLLSKEILENILSSLERGKGVLSASSGC